jgi:four helix bundle protein
MSIDVQYNSWLRLLSMPDTRHEGSIGSDQLHRAALSIPLSIDDGTEKGDRDAARFLHDRSSSVLECAAIFDVLETLGAVASEEPPAGAARANRVNAHESFAGHED